MPIKIMGGKGNVSISFNLPQKGNSGNIKIIKGKENVSKREYCS